MSRRLVISILILLIVGVVGGTSFFVYTWWRERNLATNEGEGGLQEAEVVDPTADDDNDGLNNGDERIWGTDPRNPDTDGDGFRDGEEVNANRNPTIAAPNDRLPEGFQPGRDINPLDIAPNEPLPVDQFFVDNLDLTGGDRNLTEAYNSEYSEAERTKDTLADFALVQPIITSLPRPAERTINLQPADSGTLIENYVLLAGGFESLSLPDLAEQAVTDAFQGNTSTAQGTALSVRLFQEDLIEQPVPPSAENVHKLLLGYTELLAATYDQIALATNDSVKALVAVRQLEEIQNQYIPLIDQELERLRLLSI